MAVGSSSSWWSSKAGRRWVARMVLAAPPAAGGEEKGRWLLGGTPCTAGHSRRQSEPSFLLRWSKFVVWLTGKIWVPTPSYGKKLFNNIPSLPLLLLPSSGAASLPSHPSTSPGTGIPPPHPSLPPSFPPFLFPSRLSLHPSEGREEQPGRAGPGLSALAPGLVAPAARFPHSPHCHLACSQNSPLLPCGPVPSQRPIFCTCPSASSPGSTSNHCHFTGILPPHGQFRSKETPFLWPARGRPQPPAWPFHHPLWPSDKCHFLKIVAALGNLKVKYQLLALLHGDNLQSKAMPDLPSVAGKVIVIFLLHFILTSWKQWHWVLFKVMRPAFMTRKCSKINTWGKVLL